MMIESAKSLTVAARTLCIRGRSSLWIGTAAGPQIGFGHLKRSMVLAKTLQDCCRPLFVLDPEDRWSQAQLKNQDCDCFCEGFEKAWSLLPDPTVIIIDTCLTTGLDKSIERARNRGIPVLSIHDLGLYPIPSDVIIDGSIDPAHHDFPRPNTGFFSGPNFMILDPGYHPLHQQSKSIHEKIQSIFINLGGGDSSKYFSRILDGLKLWAREVDVVGVPGFASWGQERLANKEWRPLHFHWESQNIERHLFHADLAITSGGIAIYEALCAGTPALGLSYHSLQQTTLTMLSSRGACVDLGPGDLLDPTGIPRLLSLVETDIGRRKLLSSRGRQIVDGLGAERVAQIVRELIRKRSSEAI